MTETAVNDRSLGARGPKRRIVLRAPYLSAGAILPESDLVATLSRRIAEQFFRTHALQLRERPIKSPIVRTAILCGIGRSTIILPTAGFATLSSL